MKKILLFFSCLLLAAIAYTQPLDTLLRRAETHNPLLQAQRWNFEASLQKAGQVSQLPDPELGLGVFVLPIETREGAQWVRLGISQPLPWIGTLKARASVAKEQAMVEFWKVHQNKLELFAQIRQQYAVLEGLHARQVMVEKYVDLYQQLEGLATRRLESGQGGLEDVLRIQMKGLELAEEVRLLEVRKRKPLAALNRLLGQSPEAPVEVSDSLAEAIFAFEKEALLEALPAWHPEVQLLEQQEKLAQQRKELVRYDRKPQLVVGLDYIWVGRRHDEDFHGSGRDALMPRIGAKIPLNQKRFRLQEEEEAFRISALQEQQENLHWTLAAELENLLAQLEEASIQVDLFRSQQATLKTVYELLLAKYAVGQARMEEVLSVVEQRWNYELKELDALVQGQQVLSHINRFVASENGQ